MAEIQTKRYLVGFVVPLIRTDPNKMALSVQGVFAKDDAQAKRLAHHLIASYYFPNKTFSGKFAEYIAGLDEKKLVGSERQVYAAVQTALKSIQVYLPPPGESEQESKATVRARSLAQIPPMSDLDKPPWILEQDETSKDKKSDAKDKDTDDDMTDTKPDAPKSVTLKSVQEFQAFLKEMPLHVWYKVPTERVKANPEKFNFAPGYQYHKLKRTEYTRWIYMPNNERVGARTPGRSLESTMTHMSGHLMLPLTLTVMDS